MTRHLPYPVLLLLLALLGVSVAMADVPRTVSFQGNLDNAGGGSADGPFTFTFRIYDDPVGGNMLWSELHENVPVDGGSFVVSLGSITPFDFRADQPLWLGITVAGDANELAPRQAIQSQPSAIITSLLEIGDTVYDVDCDNGGSINQALESPRRFGRLIINVSGTCQETVVIRTRKVTINGVANSPRILSPNAGQPALVINASQDNAINNITLDGGSLGGTAPAVLLRDAAQAFFDGVTMTGGGANGLQLMRNATAYVTASTIQNNATSGAQVSYGGVLHLDHSSVASNGQSGVLVDDGGVLRLEYSSVAGPVSDANCDINNSECDAILLVRGADANIRYDNTLTATVVGAWVLDALYNSQARVQYGSNVINGPLRAGFNSHIELRDSTTTGNVQVFANSTFRMRSGAALTGDINVASMSGMFSLDPFTVTGSISCEYGRSAAYVNWANVSGGMNSQCNWSPSLEPQP